MLARVALLLAVVALAAPSVALGQGNPFAPPPAAPPQTTTEEAPAPTSSTEDDGGSLGTAGEIAIYGLGGLLLFGIGWMVVRDARRRAPVEERVSQPRGTHSPQRHARARAKAKAARQQRKRNRARR
jgi:hypothetical protein